MEGVPLLASTTSTDADPLAPIPPHILSRLDPEFIEKVLLPKSTASDDDGRREPPLPPLQTVSIEEVRADRARWQPPCAMDAVKEGVEGVGDHKVRSADGEEVEVRVYTPEEAREGGWGVHLNFHGGGFVLGDLTTEGSMCLDMRDNAGVVVVDVNYRHCPETPWGRCIEDGWAVLQWVRSSAQLLNINPDSVSIGGISAGAHISIILAYLAHDAGIPLILCMPSVPPCSTAMQYDSWEESPHASFREYRDGPILSWETIRWFSGLCFPRDQREEDWEGRWPAWWTDPMVRAGEDLGGLCEMFVRTAELDPFRDEGEEFARRVAEGGGKEVRVKRYEGSVHTFMQFPGLARKREFDEDGVEALRRAHGM